MRETYQRWFSYQGKVFASTYAGKQSAQKNINFFVKSA